jgi:uncharacterized protein with von Willebrand factor type A (vWA) domain
VIAKVNVRRYVRLNVPHDPAIGDTPWQTVQMGEEVVVAMDMTIHLVLRDLWGECKAATALVIESLRHNVDRPPIVIGYNEFAQALDPATVPELEPDFVFGTNVQGALQMARYSLDEANGQKRVVFIAEADASAYCEADGNIRFEYPPTEENRQITLNEARACSIAGIRIDFLLLTPTAPIDEFARSRAWESGGLVSHLSGTRPLEDDVHTFLSDIGLICPA